MSPLQKTMDVNSIEGELIPIRLDQGVPNPPVDSLEQWIGKSLINTIHERDLHTCCCCGFRSVKYQEVL
ncbi:MAG: hypothetical protein AAFO69_16915, partial [Bacteroidota bacterium]